MNRIVTYLLTAIWLVMSENAFAQISTPLDLADLIFWVDGQDINATGVQPSNGSVITTWVDKSSYGNDLTSVAVTVTFEETGFDGISRA